MPVCDLDYHWQQWSIYGLELEMGIQFLFPGTQHILDVNFEIQRISKSQLYVMLIPLSDRLFTKLLFPVLAWTFNPTSTGKGSSFFVERWKFWIF